MENNDNKWEKATLTKYVTNEDGTHKYNTDVENVEIYTKVPKMIFRKGEFFLKAGEFVRLVLKKLVDDDYGKTDMKVLYFLLDRLDYNNRIRSFYQKDMAMEIDSTQANVSRSLKKLVESGVLIVDGKDYYFSVKYIAGAGDKDRPRK